MGHRHTVHTLHFEGTTDLVFSNLVSGSHSVNFQTIKPDTGGPYVEQVFIQSIEERFEAVLEALEEILDNFSLNQVTCVGSGLTYTAIQLFGRRLDACGTDGTASGSNHRQVAGSLGRVVLTQLQGNANGNVQATLQGIMLSSDGDTAPTATVVNAALPTQALVPEAFKLHGIKVGNVTLDSDKITSFTLSTGINVIPEFGVKNYPQAVSVTKTAPMITIETEETTLLSSFALTGSKATHANSLIEIRKRDATTGGLIATGSSEHISITFAGHVRIEPFSGSGSSKATARLTIECSGVAGTPPLTAATDAALTL